MAETSTTPGLRMPPGPRLPRALQTAGFMLAGPRFIEACRRRYGDAVTFGTLFDSKFVMVFDPALVKQVFQGSGTQLRAGEANAMLGPVLGERSVLLLDGAEHLRHRRLLLPPFHGQRMQAYEEVMRESADSRDRLLAGRRAVRAAAEHAVAHFAGDHAGGVRLRARARRGELRDRLRAMIEPMARPRGLMLMYLLTRPRRRPCGRARFEEQPARGRRDPVREIARRRDGPVARRARRVFSALLLAEDEDGSG